MPTVVEELLADLEDPEIHMSQDEILEARKALLERARMLGDSGFEEPCQVCSIRRTG